jgi:Arc/MetJ family transcription regulator
MVLDEDLIAEASRLTGIQNKRALVHEALRILIEQKRRRPLSELRGKVRFAAGYDCKAARRCSTPTRSSMRSGRNALDFLDQQKGGRVSACKAAELALAVQAWARNVGKTRAPRK